jgi:hypothetical protein
LFDLHGGKENGLDALGIDAHCMVLRKGLTYSAPFSDAAVEKKENHENAKARNHEKE